MRREWFEDMGTCTVQRPAARTPTRAPSGLVILAISSSSRWTSTQPAWVYIGIKYHVTAKINYTTSLLEIGNTPCLQYIDGVPCRSQKRQPGAQVRMASPVRRAPAAFPALIDRSSAELLGRRAPFPGVTLYMKSGILSDKR